MKSIINILIICLFLVAIIGISQNNSSDMSNESFFIVDNISKYTTDMSFFKSVDKNSFFKFQIKATEASYNNVTIEINMSHIHNITFIENKMIIQTK